MSDRRGRIICGATWRAAANRLTLVSTGLTAVTALVFQSGTVFLIAACGWVASFTVNLTRSRVWREAGEVLDLEPIDLPLDSSLRDKLAKQFLARLTSTRADRTEVLKDLQPAAAPRARIISMRATELERPALTLIQAIDRMNGYLGSAPTASLRAELIRLQQQLRETGPGPVQRETERARVSLQGQLETTEHIEGCRALVSARLEAVLAALEALPGRLLRAEVCHASLRSLQDDGALDDLQRELESLDAAGRAALDSEGACVGDAR